MSTKRIPFYETLKKLSTGATTETLFDETTEPGKKRVYTQVVAIDETTTYTSLAMVAGLEGDEQEFDYVGAPQATERVEYDGPEVHVPAGERLGCEFVGTTTDDVLIVYLRGWLEVQNV